jgi:hypothetical protein
MPLPLFHCLPMPLVEDNLIEKGLLLSIKKMNFFQ